MNNRYLLESNPLIINRELACAIGLNNAIVLRQIYFWISNKEEAESEKHFQKERWWVYNAYTKWQKKNFPFWSADTVRNILWELEELRLIVSDNFNTAGFDKTKWYTINWPIYDLYLKLWVEHGMPRRNNGNKQSKLFQKFFDSFVEALKQRDETPPFMKVSLTVYEGFINELGTVHRPIPEINSENSTETTLKNNFDAVGIENAVAVKPKIILPSELFLPENEELAKAYADKLTTDLFSDNSQGAQMRKAVESTVKPIPTTIYPPIPASMKAKRINVSGIEESLSLDNSEQETTKKDGLTLCLDNELHKCTGTKGLKESDIKKLSKQIEFMYNDVMYKQSPMSMYEKHGDQYIKWIKAVFFPYWKNKMSHTDTGVKLSTSKALELLSGQKSFIDFMDWLKANAPKKTVKTKWTWDRDCEICGGIDGYLPNGKKCSCWAEREIK